MLHFSSTLVVCMQSRHQDCRQHFCTLCLQGCNQNFFRAPLGILAGKSPGYYYQYWWRFWSRSRDQNFRAFFQASNGTYFKNPVPTPPDHITRTSPYIIKNCPLSGEDIPLRSYDLCCAHVPHVRPPSTPRYSSCPSTEPWPLVAGKSLHAQRMGRETVQATGGPRVGTIAHHGHSVGAPRLLWTPQSQSTHPAVPVSLPLWTCPLLEGAG